MSLDHALKNQNLMGYFKSLTDQGQVLKDLEVIDKAYYDGKPLVPDSTYDVLRDYVNMRFPEIKKKVGKMDNGNSVWPKANLEIPMGSLDKMNTEDEFRKFYPKTSGTNVVSHKMDGSSLEVSFADGKFVRAVTRGDGFVGEDITPNAHHFKFPKEVPEKGLFKVRCEAMLFKDAFSKHFAPKGEKNPRNSAAGAVRGVKNNAGKDHIVLVAFDIIMDDDVQMTKMGKFKLLQQLGFVVPNPILVNSAEDVIKIFEHTASIRASLPYEIDGLVIEENDLAKAEEMGVVDNRPKAARAWKFPAESAECTLLDVQWQIGKTGALTPVGIITPTTIQGVTIQRVMLNNLDHIRNELKLDIGSKATLIRANDVIPKITKALTPGKQNVVAPINCPSCGTKLNQDDLKHIHCPNHEECPAQTAYRITHFLSVLDVKGMGDSIVEKLIDEGIIRDIPDLYTIDMSKVEKVEGVAATNVLKAYRELILKSKKVSLPKFVKAISIKNIGASATEAAMAKYPTIHDMFTATTDELTKIEGIGDSIANDFVFGFNAKKDLILKLLNFVTITAQAQGSLSGMAFCFTGFRDSDLQEQIESKGGTMTASVTKSTTHLVCATTESLSTKAQKAKKEGKTILSKKELEEMLANA
jgi:DNA ligase (NAD+)